MNLQGLGRVVRTEPEAGESARPASQWRSWPNDHASPPSRSIRSCSTSCGGTICSWSAPARFHLSPGSGWTADDRARHGVCRGSGLASRWAPLHRRRRPPRCSRGGGRAVHSTPGCRRSWCGTAGVPRSALAAGVVRVSRLGGSRSWVSPARTGRPPRPALLRHLFNDRRGGRQHRHARCVRRAGACRRRRPRDRSRRPDRSSCRPRWPSCVSAGDDRTWRWRLRRTAWTRAGSTACVRGGSLHQPHARPSRLSRHDGGVPRRQAQAASLLQLDGARGREPRR